MTSQHTNDVVRAWYGHLVMGEMEQVLQGMTEDVEFEIPRFPHNAVVPWAGLWRGRAEVQRAFELRDAALKLEAFELQDVVAEGDKAFATIHERSVNKSTGRSFDILIVQELTVRGDQVATWKAYYDPYPVVASFDRPDEDLIGAVADGDAGRVADALAAGARVDARDAVSGLTALMMAAAQADVGLVKLLLAHGADPLTTDTLTGATPLHKACQGGSVEVARMLVEAGAFVDAVTPTMGHTPIMDALWYKWPDLVQFLVDQGANLNFGTHYGFSLMEHLQFESNVNIADKEKMDAIHAIIEARQAEVQAQIDAQPLMTATIKGEVDQARALLRDGAAPHTVYPHVNSFADGHTPLLVAARDGHTELVADLLAAGAPVLVEDWVFKGAPIHKATYNGNAGILKLILTAPDVDIDVQGPINGYTPIHDALWHGFVDCAEILLEAGARLDLKGHDGKRPLEVAIDTLGDDHPFIATLRQHTDNQIPAEV